jgi:hypothetical protein
MERNPSNNNNGLKGIFNPFERMNSYTFLYFILILLIILIYYMQKKLRGYLNHRNKLKSMAADYERKRESRNELKFHYFWALDRGERNNAMSIGKQILQMDKELKELYQQYQFYKKKGFYELKKI